MDGLDTQAIAVTVSDVVESNHAPTVAASDRTATRGQVINASSLFSASDADGDHLLYFFYDNSADPASGHFTVGGAVRRRAPLSLCRRSSWRRPPSRRGHRALTICT